MFVEATIYGIDEKNEDAIEVKMNEKTVGTSDVDAGGSNGSGAVHSGTKTVCPESSGFAAESEVSAMATLIGVLEERGLLDERCRPHFTK